MSPGGGSSRTPYLTKPAVTVDLARRVFVAKIWGRNDERTPRRDARARIDDALGVTVQVLDMLRVSWRQGLRRSGLERH